MSDVIYGLIGHRLSHSYSVPIHRMLGCPGYRLIELEPEEIAPFLGREDLAAVNVTNPYKRDVMEYCDVIDDTAAEIGSVNTIVRREDGRLYGFNTDAEGFCGMAGLAGIDFSGKKTLILGSGGTSLTACTVARQRGASQTAVISRHGSDNYGNLSKHADAQIIVNTTPVGMYPENGASPVDLRQFPMCEGVLDVIYNPHRTALLLQAEELGIPCADGLYMLVSQAVAAEKLFFGIDIPDSENMRIFSSLRRDMTNIVLIGMPGCGKSAVGAELARISQRDAIDIDSEIEKSAGLSIPEIFRRYGEPEFRRLERQETEKAGRQSGRIIITGGGVVKDIRNYSSLHQNGRVYHLLRATEALPTAGRPLSEGCDLSAMWQERRPMYEYFRDTSVENNGTVAETAEKIWRAHCEYSCH